RRPGARPGAARRPAGPPSEPALGWPAAARRARARAGVRAGHPAPRRTDGRARQEAARGSAARTAPAAARPGRDHDPGDARPGGGPVAVDPARGAERGPGAAGRHADERVSSARQPLRGRVHRHRQRVRGRGGPGVGDHRARRRASRAVHRGPRRLGARLAGGASGAPARARCRARQRRRRAGQRRRDRLLRPVAAGAHAHRWRRARRGRRQRRAGAAPGRATGDAGLVTRARLAHGGLSDVPQRPVRASVADAQKFRVAAARGRFPLQTKETVMRRTVLWKALCHGLVAMGFAATTAFAQSGSAPKELRMLESGGPSGDSIEQAYIKPFTEKTGIKVVRESPTSTGKLQAMVQSGNITSTLVELGATNVVMARTLGLIEPLDWDAIKPGPLYEEAKWPDAFGYQYFSTIMAWRKGEKPLATWADFWNVKEFPGKRALPDYPSYTLALALLADGVKPEELYPLDVDRAFASLEKLKDHVAA